MPLESYKQKRNFRKSPEPTGGTPSGNKLQFVIQKHHASHLHYDFRLELRGVLKSWAVPKGPSMDPSEKRLAMLVEDHPWDYKDFEGIIPSGYGKGTVIVWDQGFYETEAITTKDKETQEHSISSQFWKGNIKLTLHGHKVKGQFTLVKAKEKGDNSWYLVKVKDKFATTKDITTRNKSVLSKKTLEQVAENPPREWQSHKPGKESEEKEATSVQSDILSLVKAGKKAAMPAKVEPMTCTLIKEVFNDPAWIYELKLDGYRIMAHVKKKKVTLYSRSGLDYTKYYPAVSDALKELAHDAIIDGEITVLDEDGKPNFDKLQKYNGKEPLIFYAFDIIWIDGYNVTGLDLISRKEILQQILPANDIIRYTDHFEDGDALYQKVKQMELEGIVAKRKDSTYQAGKRTKDWLKLPTEIRQEFVIGGWTESGSGRTFRSLLFGAYENGKLMCIGHAGGGYKEKEMPAILSQLKKLEIKKNPFANKVDAETKVHYVKPSLVGNFKFATWTASGKIRKPAIFLGFRDDKNPKEVVREVPLTKTAEKEIVEEPVIKPSAKQSREKKDTGPNKEAISESNWTELKKEKVTSHDSITIEGKEVELSNVEKELWQGVTKASIIQYYHEMAGYILPYLRDRPQSLHIKNINAGAPGMYIKDMEGNQPAWATVFSTKRKHPKKGKRNTIDYLVCQDEATLLYMINLGCIDINPWTSRIDSYQEPDFIIIDLDPSDDDFGKVIKTAQAAKKVFDKLNLTAFPKTSGKSGMHLYIPCKDFSFPEARTIALNICSQVHAIVPDITTTENSISKRGNKLFIDYNQNDEADTVAAPYSVRPAKSPTISTPLEWKEITEKLSPSNFTISTIGKRLKNNGDVFIKVLNKRIATSNTKILKGFLS